MANTKWSYEENQRLLKIMAEGHPRERKHAHLFPGRSWTSVRHHAHDLRRDPDLALPRAHAPYKHKADPEEIRICLNCTRRSCPGSCARVRDLGVDDE